MRQKYILFIVNLLQDINIIRPLVYLAARELDAGIGFLVTSRFMQRDRQQTWQRELAQMCADVHGDMFIFDTPAEAYRILQGKSGILIAASESDLPGHSDTHNAFRIAPSSFLKITLQHGYECVGFLQNREHNKAHGRNVTFAADIICGWCEPRALTALAVSERPKLYVSGPSTILQVPTRGPDHPPVAGGLVCENLHSVRLRTGGNFGASFMDVFFQFCGRLAEHGQVITLRPHPGGQYVLKNNVQLPDQVTINNLPMYRVNLKSYAFGISAPSTVVLDMVLARIPVAVWHDDGGVMDFSNYEGLTDISGLDDWLAFARDVAARRDMLLDRQRRFLERIPMPTDPKEVYRRFARLLANGSDTVSGTIASVPGQSHAVDGSLARVARPVTALGL
ncbi:hypothetical protein [Microvirga roseola]|uniref:hypothetical protein n=1 Tax=Microvirga roseola TaxID=2883126 RepID=UPI001E33A005|nr:hypothetical protein [Microvirga roseola]